MSIQICGAPCCWGVDDPKNPYLPPWTRVLEEAGKAGYSAIELGPYGYLPIDAELVANDRGRGSLPFGERFLSFPVKRYTACNTKITRQRFCVNRILRKKCLVSMFSTFCTLAVGCFCAKCIIVRS